MNAYLPKTAQLSLAMAQLLQQNTAFAVFRTLVAQRLALRPSRPPPDAMANVPAWLLRDLGLHEPRDPE